jgi:hypothetical protein
VLAACLGAAARRGRHVLAERGTTPRRRHRPHRRTPVLSIISLQMLDDPIDESGCSQSSVSCASTISCMSTKSQFAST